MLTVSVIVFSVLISTALSVPVKSNEETMTLFDGEDFHIQLYSLNTEVTFRNRSATRSQASEERLMRGGKSVSGRAKVNSHLSHLIIESVKGADEGVYTVKNPDNPDDVKRIILIVRDCSNEQTVKYGDNYHIPLDVSPPITLEYRSISVDANQTSRSPLVLLTVVGTIIDPYRERISIKEKHITLSAVTGADEGSYTVRGAKGEIKSKMCLNVREHQLFLELPHGKRLKINLILNSSLVQMYYTRNSDPAPRTSYLLLDKGEFTNAQTDLGLEARISLDGSMFFLDQIKASDAGEFKVIDNRRFPVTIVHLEIKPFKLEKLYVAIIALLGFVVFLLLACLVSCLFKVKKRAKRAAALEKLAKEDNGEAFRQVVKNITKLSEESKHSQADNTEKSQSTEVDIKGLEVSSKEVGVGNLETSDSGVGFNTALPLDTDTDVADQIPDSEAASITAPAEAKSTEVKLSPAPSPAPKASSSPVDPKPSPSPESKSPAPKAPTPTPETKSTLAPIPEPPKTTTPEPITNGTPETGPGLKPSPDHTELIGGSTAKAVPPKTPEVELKTSCAGLDVKVESSKEGPVAADSTTT